MNQRHTRQFQFRQPTTIRWRGKRCTLSEAGTLAAQEQLLGNLEAAAEIFKLMLVQMPNSAELHNNRGVMLQKMNRFAEALTCYDKALRLKPAYANAHFNRGLTLKKLNRLEEALASYDQALSYQPDHIEACHNRGVVLQELRRYDDAMACYDKVLAIKPGHVEACNNRGTALMSKGRVSEAEQMFLKAIELKPDFPDPLFNLANVRKHQSADNPETRAIRTLLDKSGITSEDKEQLYFALGKIYDDCGRYDEAFDCYQQANQIRNARVSYSAETVTKTTDGIIEVFTRDFLSQPFEFASESSAPLFIVGMPRSGTTLLANMLSNHHAIAMAGELSTITDLASRLPEWNGNGVTFPQAARHVTETVARRMMEDYEKRLRRDVALDVPHVIDKNPLNFWNLGFIAKLFPKARILHCIRHPLDTGLSNYFQRFPLYLDYSFDLRNIGHFYREYARLMEHWRTIPTLNWMEISYEDMILNTEQTARRALEFLGLDWDERCLTPHTNPGAVETASQWQVRQPIYRHSIERWRHYEKHLASLMEMLPP